MAKVMSICNQKGGVGKTTTAINLGAYLANAGKKTLLIDMDPQGNTTSGLGMNKDTLAKSVYNVLIDGLDAEKAIVTTGINNLELLPSNVDLIGSEVEFAGLMERESRLRKAINSIIGHYDYIIMDCPPSLGLLTINALTASDTVLIPIQCEYYALEGLSQLLKTIDLVCNQLNPSLRIEGAVLTMADYRTNLASEVIADVRGFFKEKVFETVIPRSIRVAEAPGFGKPLLLYDQSCAGAQKYKELTHEILARETP